MSQFVGSLVLFGISCELEWTEFYLTFEVCSLLGGAVWREVFYFSYLFLGWTSKCVFRPEYSPYFVIWKSGSTCGNDRCRIAFSKESFDFGFFNDFFETFLLGFDFYTWEGNAGMEESRSLFGDLASIVLSSFSISSIIMSYYLVNCSSTSDEDMTRLDFLDY